MNIKLKRAYEAPTPQDGERYLVDRLWPRGLKHEALDLADWNKEVAPSNALRAWYHHDTELWDEFCRRYREELDAKPEVWQPLLAAAQRGTITLVYGSKDSEHNNAVALKAYVEQQFKPARSA